MTTESLLPDPSPTIEQAFNTVAERMRGLGFVNPELRVQAVGFAPWEGHWLGVLVTPWSINLMLLPRDRTLWRSVRPGEKLRYAFPAGVYDFIDATDPQVGEYRMCSLFSPALDFKEHEAAVLVATLALSSLLDPANADTPDAQPAEAGPGPLTRIEQKADEPMSKRDFLRGRFLRADEPHVSRG
jgi:[NiFe] hydrogenase assembly HybE family chaperone